MKEKDGIVSGGLCVVKVKEDKGIHIYFPKMEDNTKNKNR